MQIEQTARRRDEQLDTLIAEHALLRRDRNSPIDAPGPHTRETGVRAGGFVDLCRQFTRRHQHEGAQGARPVEQAAEGGQQERGGLARARLGGGNKIMAGKNEGNGTTLDRGRSGVAGGANSASYGFGQAEGSKRHGFSWLKRWT